MRAGWPGRMGQLVLDLFGVGLPAESSSMPASSKLPHTENKRPGPKDALRPPERANGKGEPQANPTDGLEDVTIGFSSRLKRSWRLEQPRSPRPLLHLPREFETAPPEIWRSLATWVAAHRAPHPGSRALARRESAKVFLWMGERSDRRPVGDAKGRCHDLAPLFERLNREHFQGRLQALVRWSPKPGGLSTHRTLKLPEGPRHVITIGQLYDHPEVPVFAVEGVLFHEMLHIEYPPIGEGLRRQVHHAAFRRAERAFPGYLAWKDWERHQAPRLLGALRRKEAQKRRRRRT